MCQVHWPTNPKVDQMQFNGVTADRFQRMTTELFSLGYRCLIWRVLNRVQTTDNWVWVSKVNWKSCTWFGETKRIGNQTTKTVCFERKVWWQETKIHEWIFERLWKELSDLEEYFDRMWILVRRKKELGYMFFLQTFDLPRRFLKAMFQECNKDYPDLTANNWKCFHCPVWKL